MITVKNINKRYGKKQVLNNISFKVNQGEIYGFLGKNGAGKSTTLNILTSLIQSDSGDFKINSDRIGYLPESPVFHDHLTGYEYLEFINSIANKPTSKNDIMDKIELVGLGHAINKRIKTYSRGMKQRLGIASVILNDPDLIILDEPSSALDPQGRKDILDILLKLKLQKKTVFFSTHILEDVERVSDRIAILHNGNIQIESSVEDLMLSYTNLTYEVKTHSPVDMNIFKSISKVSQVAIENDIYILSLTQENKNLFKELAGLNIEIISFNMKKTTLEDIFIRMVSSHE